MNLKPVLSRKPLYTIEKILWMDLAYIERFLNFPSNSLCCTHRMKISKWENFNIASTFTEPRLSVLGLTQRLSFKKADLTCLFSVSGDNTGHKGYMTDGLQQNSYYLVWDRYRNLNKICILLQIRGSLGVGRWWCQQQECGNKTKHREGNLYSNLLILKE